MFFRKQKSVGNDNSPAPVPPTYIGADTRIDGNIETESELQIEGQVRGAVRAGVCVIAASGIVEGDISAEEVIVGGRVIGPLRAIHVHLQPGAIVEGDITSETIAIETGAKLSGAVWQVNRDDQLNGRSDPTFGGLEPGSLWTGHNDEPFRPLKTVQPRSLNGSRS